MNKEEFHAALLDVVAGTPINNIMEQPASHLGLLELLNKLEPGSSDGLRNQDIVELVVNPERLADETPSRFLRACSDDPDIGLEVAGDLWANLDSSGFLKACTAYPQRGLEYCAKTWHELDATSFRHYWKNYSWFASDEAARLYAADKPAKFLEKCHRGAERHLGAKVWLEVDPEGYISKCIKNRGHVFWKMPEVALWWKEADPVSFWIAVEEHLVAIANEDLMKPSKEEQRKIDDTLAGMMVNPTFEQTRLAGELAYMVIEERPELIKPAIPHLDASRDGYWGNINALTIHSEKWQQLDEAGYSEAVWENPSNALLGIGRLGADGRKRLLLGLGTKTGESPEPDDLENLTDTLAEEKESAWEETYALVDGLDQAVTQYLEANDEQGEKVALAALLYLHSQAARADELERGNNPIISALADKFNEELCASMVKYNLNGYLEMFQITAGVIMEGPGGYTDSDQYARSLLEIVNYTKSNSDDFLQRLKDNPLGIDDTTEILIDLTLAETQKQDLVKWILETPGLNETTLSYALRHAGNLPAVQTLKIRKAPRRDTGESLGIT